MKRIVGLPGETIEIRDKQLFVNGSPLAEPYVHHEDREIYPRNDMLPEPYRSRDQFGPLTIPASHYFMLGDNRDRSHDSRWWGALPAKNVIGRAVLVGMGWRFHPP